jgi:hypothetical protein
LLSQTSRTAHVAIRAEERPFSLKHDESKQLDHPIRRNHHLLSLAKQASKQLKKSDSEHHFQRLIR